MGKIDFELALRLEKAGFPQEGKGERISNGEPVLWDRVKDAYVLIDGKPEKYVEVYEPTLSELIERLGDNLTNLHRDGYMEFAAISDVHKVFYGHSTPEAACAELWLDTGDGTMEP